MADLRSRVEPAPGCRWFWVPRVGGWSEATGDGRICHTALPHHTSKDPQDTSEGLSPALLPTRVLSEILQQKMCPRGKVSL
jgi:hypothetical protein